jgi:aminoglycoside 3-N-acetyltransferase
VVPSQTTLNSLTSNAFLAATVGLNAEERGRYFAAMPGFNPASTPSNGMGVFAEFVRMHPSAYRSNHPQVSFAALGPGALACTSVHDLHCHLGDRSPLGWLYAADAAILLLGVGYSVCTAFHLAEYRQAGVPPLRRYRCFTSHRARVEHDFTGVALDDSDFELLGADLDSDAARDIAPAVRCGQVGAAACRLISLRRAVDFAHTWLAVHRDRSTS